MHLPNSSEKTMTTFPMTLAPMFLLVACANQEQADININNEITIDNGCCGCDDGDCGFDDGGYCGCDGGGCGCGYGGDCCVGAGGCCGGCVCGHGWMSCCRCRSSRHRCCRHRCCCVMCRGYGKVPGCVNAWEVRQVFLSCSCWHGEWGWDPIPATRGFRPLWLQSPGGLCYPAPELVGSCMGRQCKRFLRTFLGVSA